MFEACVFMRVFVYVCVGFAVEEFFSVFLITSHYILLYIQLQK